MGRQDEVVQERLKKIAEIRKQGINPYPYKYSPSASSSSLQTKYASIKPEEYTKDTVKVAGRVMTRRDLGKIAFGTLQDGHGKIQVVLQDGETKEEFFTLFNKFIDSGDFIGVEGIVFRTKRGELSVLAKKIELLSKSLVPLPDKWHGLEDKEERYRKRYLDLLMSPAVREVFHKREKMIDAIREFLKARDFHEVDTPYLQTVYGGAAARPFTTHLNALNIPLFLAISPELYLKRLIVGGYERVFTIARNFRNEGIDRSHNPEFSMMEIYQAYADYNDMMELTEELFEYVCNKVNGTTKVTVQGKEVDFKKPWKRMTMLEAIKQFAKIDADRMDEKELAEFMRDNKVESKGNSWGWRVQAIFEHFCEDKLEQPTFIIDHPVETTPLCKMHRSGDKRLIERFEPFCLGMELANAYSELNDPILQRKMLEEQQAMLSAGEQEANPFDEDFVNAIEIGLPPTGGLGIGIDRMIILLTGQESIRDVLLFPFMKPQGHGESKSEKSKETKVAVAIINEGAKMEPWQQMNTIAHLNAAFGARAGKGLLYQDKIQTQDAQDINLNIQHAIMIKQCKNNKQIVELLKGAKSSGLEIAEFTREMIMTTDDRKVIDMTSQKSHADVEYLGLLVFGEKKKVEALTLTLPLFGSFEGKPVKKESSKEVKKSKKK
jgi:lysyl-tRNA synthetase, class II